MTTPVAHRTNWTSEEFATLFDGTVKEVAARFGRTEFAVAKMREEVLYERRTGPAFRQTDVSVKSESRFGICESCRIELPATGDCGWC